MWNGCGGDACRGAGCTEGCRGETESRGNACCGGRTGGQCGFPHGGRPKIRQGDRLQGALQDLQRSVQRQQSREYQWWIEVGPKGRRLLERVQQETEGFRLNQPTLSWPGLSRPSTSAPFASQSRRGCP